MSMDAIGRQQRIIQWVAGGAYAVSVEVDAVIPYEDPSEPCLTPETVRYLESLADAADAGDLEVLSKAGTVYTLVETESSN